MPDIEVKDDTLFIKGKPIRPSRITVLFLDAEFFDDLYLIKIEPRQYIALFSLSTRTKKPLHQLISEAIDEYVSQNLKS